MSITSHDELRERYPRPPTDRVVRKELDHLDRHCRTFIAASPFLVLATAGADGALDVSPRGDLPGFCHVRGEGTLLIPDRPGNNRLDSLTNLVDNPRASAIFMIPGVDETLRVAGSTQILDGPTECEPFAVDGKLPATVIALNVEQAYLHCAKAFMRSGLWRPDSWPAERPVPTLGAMIHDQIGGDEETQEAMLARYREAMW